MKTNKMECQFSLATVPREAVKIVGIIRYHDQHHQPFQYILQCTQLFRTTKLLWQTKTRKSGYYGKGFLCLTSYL